MQKSITRQAVESFADQVAKEPGSFTVLQRAVTSNGIYASSENNFLSATHTTVFSDEIETAAVTDQKDSGRCWLFATLNTMRHQIAKDFNLEDFELSETYSYFWDKLEKSNAFYELIIATGHAPLDDREVEYQLNCPQGDGGWWEYAAAVITKYGIVPKHVMPEAVATSKSYELNVLLNRKLRKDALTLRELVASKHAEEEVYAAKKTMLGEVYRILTVAIGTPPQSFNFSYRDKDKKFHRDEGITPLEFLKKYTKEHTFDYVSLLNDPTPTKSYEQTYAFRDGINVVDGPQQIFLNVDMQTMKNLARKQLKAGESIWFGCDVGTDTNRKGFMAPETYDFNGTFGVDFTLDKAGRLMSRDSSVTHAMTITGVDIVNGKPAQWKVENSWGEDRGLKGYYTMSNDWFDRNGYVVVIRRNLLPAKLQKVLEKPPVLIPSWDPLNSAAVS